MDKSLRKLFFLLLLITIGLFVMHYITVHSRKEVSLSFNLSKEGNVPTWFSSALLFSVSYISFLIFILSKKSADGVESWNKFWAYFAAAYCFLSLDEIATIHERIGLLTSVKWIYIYAPFALTFFLFSLIYFARIRKDDKYLRDMILGGMIIYASGGMGLEAIEYFLETLPPDIQFAQYVIEEGMEMIGTIFVLTGCIGELSRLYRKLDLKEKTV